MNAIKAWCALGFFNGTWVELWRGENRIIRVWLCDKVEFGEGHVVHFSMKSGHTRLNFLKFKLDICELRQAEWSCNIIPLKRGYWVMPKVPWAVSAPCQNRPRTPCPYLVYLPVRFPIIILIFICTNKMIFNKERKSLIKMTLTVMPRSQVLHTHELVLDSYDTRIEL